MTPELGLVCMTFSDECRFRTITRSRFLTLAPAQRRQTLRELYQDNIARLGRTIEFCRRERIGLYRMPSSLFPMSDEPLGRRVLRTLAPELARVGQLAADAGICIVDHPEQFVVLSSENPAVVKTSILILAKEALAMDLIGLPRSPWAALIIHGGKAGRGDALVETIAQLPEAIRARLCLENDELAYSAAETLTICQRAKVPMVFDNLHHVIKEKIDRYDDPSLLELTRAAAQTWQDPAWQIVHLSNGRDSFRDRRHSELISEVPPAFEQVPWIEVEAKGKERAIAALRASGSGGTA